MPEDKAMQPHMKRDLTGSIKTCDVCRLRHQRCNGGRPCYHCELRGLECNYTNISTAKNKSRKTHRPSSASQTTSERELHRNGLLIQAILQEELASLEITPSCAHDLFDRITKRISKRTVLMPRAFERPLMTPISPQALVNLLGTILANRSGRSLNDILPNLRISGSLAPPLGLLPAAIPSSNQDLTTGLPAKALAHAWLETLLHGPNNLIGIVEASDSFRMLNSLYANQGLSQKESCLITFQLAVGARFTENTPDYIHCIWYDRARAQLENCIELEDGLLIWIIQPLLLSCIYLMTSRPKMCRVLLGVAVNLAQRYCIDVPFDQCPFFGQTEYDHWRRLWHSVYFLDVWNGIMLGQHPQIDPTSTQDPFLRDIESNAVPPNGSLKHNLTVLAVMSGIILRDTYGVEPVQPQVYEKHLDTLQSWSSNLPDNMQFGTNMVKGGIPIHEATPALYLELFYLVAMLFLSLPQLQQSIMERPQGEEVPANVEFLAQVCTDSAIQIGHVSSTLLRHEKFCKKSWVTAIINFTATTVLLFGLTKKGPKTNYSLKSSQYLSRRFALRSGLEQCTKNLTECADNDQYSKSLLDIVHYLQVMVEPADSPESSAESKSPSLTKPYGFQRIDTVTRTGYGSESQHSLFAPTVNCYYPGYTPTESPITSPTSGVSQVGDNNSWSESTFRTQSSSTPISQQAQLSAGISTMEPSFSMVAGGFGLEDSGGVFQFGEQLNFPFYPHAKDMSAQPQMQQLQSSQLPLQPSQSSQQRRQQDPTPTSNLEGKQKQTGAEPVATSHHFDRFP